MPRRLKRLKNLSDSDRKITHTIGGHGETSDSAFVVVNPSTAAPLAQCPQASLDQLNRAAQAARAAVREWSRLSTQARRKYLHKFAARVRDYADDLATVITREQGKPLPNSAREIEMTARSLEAMSNIKVKDQILRDDEKNRISLHFRPLGVVGAITPWNVPLGLAAHKIAQALIAGNTMVLKPSPYTPIATLLLGELSRDMLPPGVLNILGGGNELGQALVEHPGFDKITFTGSVATGKRVMAGASGTLKRVTLELGGNDPAILLDDAEDIRCRVRQLRTDLHGDQANLCSRAPLRTGVRQARRLGEKLSCRRWIRTRCADGTAAKQDAVRQGVGPS